MLACGGVGVVGCVCYVCCLRVLRVLRVLVIVLLLGLARALVTFPASLISLAVSPSLAPPRSRALSFALSRVLTLSRAVTRSHSPGQALARTCAVRISQSNSIV